MTEPPRVRFAPSPTGYLHVGGARTALFNWLFARHAGGSFILRIEDTDRNRSRPELTEAILDGLTWLGLNWDEGPYHQADFVARHRTDAERLLASGHAYRCFCTPEELEARRREAAGDAAYMYDGRCRDLDPDVTLARARSGEPHSVRFRMPPGETVWDDLVHGRTRFANADIEDFVILRSDSTSTYQLAVVSDDTEMGITHVMRGADHTSNTPKQIQIYRALGHDVPIFGHVPLILGADGKRLSKRHGATAVRQYREAGFLPRAMVNFLALLGWSPGDDVEYMEMAELIERFSLDGINKKAAIFDNDKLGWLSGQHLSKSSAAEVADWVVPFMGEAGIAMSGALERSGEWWLQVLDLVKVRARTLMDVVSQARPFFEGSLTYEAAAIAKHWKDPEVVAGRLGRLRERLHDLGQWAQVPIEQCLRGVAAELEIGAGKLIHPLRLALTGSGVSPGIFEETELMGRELVLARIDDAMQELDAMPNDSDENNSSR